MKLSHIVCLSAALLAATLTACQKNNDPAGSVKQPGLAKAEAKAGATSIAYVDIDSLQKHYQYFQDEKKRLEALSKQYDTQLNNKMSQFQNAQSRLQQQMQKGEITYEADYKKEMAKLQRMQEEGQKLETSLAQKLSAEQEKFNKDLLDRVNAYIKEYNKDGKYSLILSKVGTSVLYADPALDITDDIVAGLNKAYKKK